jgi:hypothetical protein
VQAIKAPQITASSITARDSASAASSIVDPRVLIREGFAF